MDHACLAWCMDRPVGTELEPRKWPLSKGLLSVQAFSSAGFHADLGQGKTLKPP